MGITHGLVSSTSKNGVRNSPRKTESILPEYDFSNGVRGKYAAQYAQGTNIVLIDHDLTRKFPDSQSVNKALRRLLEISEPPSAAPKRASRRP